MQIRCRTYSGYPPAPHPGHGTAANAGIHRQDDDFRLEFIHGELVVMARSLPMTTGMPGSCLAMRKASSCGFIGGHINLLAVGYHPDLFFPVGPVAPVQDDDPVTSFCHQGHFLRAVEGLPPVPPTVGIADADHTAVQFRAGQDTGVIAEAASAVHLLHRARTGHGGTPGRTSPGSRCRRGTAGSDTGVTASPGRIRGSLRR